METKCADATRQGRLSKAKQFLEAADMIVDEDDLVDAYITLCVHAGIAAADVICCARLGVHAQGQNHDQAVILLEKVDRLLAKDLARLLGMKTRSGYSPMPSRMPDSTTAGRCATRLLEAAVGV